MESSDRKMYGSFHDYGYYQDTVFCKKKLQAGYWVWVAPKWYIWNKQNLAAVGFSATEKKFKLNQPLTIRFEYLNTHKDWAKQRLNQLGEILKKLEQYTSIPYPGPKLFRVEEKLDYQLLGMANQHKISLSAPPKGSPWTLIHEAIHIWNVNTQENWVNEGLANFVSYLMMKELKYKFLGHETWGYYQNEFKTDKANGKDYPLKNNYYKVSQGKAMAFWAMLYELWGPDFIKEVFIASLKNSHFSTSELLAIMKKYTNKNPQDLMSGWINKGLYKAKKSSDFAPVKYPLP